jgi:hypothetical protein
MTMRWCVRACPQESGSTLMTLGWSPMSTEIADLEQSAD